MKTTVATKKGYRLKKLSIETKMDSKLILLGTSSVGRVVVSEAKQETGKVNPRKGNENWGLRKGRFWEKSWVAMVAVEVSLDW